MILERKGRKDEGREGKCDYVRENKEWTSEGGKGDGQESQEEKERKSEKKLEGCQRREDGGVRGSNEVEVSEREERVKW